MKNFIIGFTLGVILMVCCGFSFKRYSPDRYDIQTRDVSLDDLAQNQRVLAEMLESAFCHD